MEANSYSEFKAEEHRTVDGNRLSEVRADDHLTVSGSRHVKVGEALLVETGQEIHLKCADKIVLEAGLGLTFKVGGSFIKIDPGGVTVSGPRIMMNTGGNPGIGSGASPLVPGLVKETDTEKPGQLLVPAQAQALGRSPRCEECEKAASEARE
ncbi:hypothetical protein PSFL111601_10125 [Pseudomonas floridensis]